MGIFGLFDAETDNSHQLDTYDFPSLTIFVNLVFGFLPWCSSNGVNFSPVFIVNRITRNSRFTLSVRLMPSFKFAIKRFFNVCIAFSTPALLSLLCCRVPFNIRTWLFDTVLPVPLPTEIFLGCLFFFGPPGICYIFHFQ